MASDAVIYSYDSKGAKTTVLSSAGAITAAVVYGIYDRGTRNIIQQFPTAAAADAGILDLLAHRSGNRDLCVVTIPV